MPRPLLNLLVAAMVVVVGLAAGADEPEEPAADDARFIVQTAYTEEIDGVYYLNADIEYSLSRAALKALESSLPLTITLEIEVTRSRHLLWDQTVAARKHSFQIAWHPLSRRYLVRDLESGDVESFPSYRAAIARLGQVSDVRVISADKLDPGSKYRVRMRAVLDLSEYAAPLRVYASFLSSWTTESDWYTWVLR